MKRSRKRSCFEPPDLLAAGLALWTFLLTDSMPLRCWLLLMWLILRRRHVSTLTLIILSFLCAFYLPARLPARPPDTRIVQVEQIRSSYVVAEAKGQRVVVYGLQQPAFGDIIRVSGEWKTLHSNHNFGAFSFDEHMAKRGIRYRISSEESETLKAADSLRARLFRHVWEYEEDRS